MRAVALLATYNERRFVGPCVRHLVEQGLDVHLIDNCSTDDTVEIACREAGKRLIGVETLPRAGVFDLREQLARKERVAGEIEADWLIHLDADEIRLPPRPGETLARALERVDDEGYNAVNFLELSFLPTREAPDHDHPDFQRTLRTYYPLLPEFPHRLNAWKKADDVDLSWKGGHRVRFAGMRMYPQSFLMKHYLFLSVPHAIEKYVRRRYPREEVEAGWHRWRDRLREDDIHLPSDAELRFAESDAHLDASNPSRYHYLTDRWAAPV